MEGMDMNYKILVAEDDRALNEGIRLALKQEGVVFEAAYTLREARELLETKKPDMLLLDVNFPDGSGFDFLKEVRRISDMPVLVITANDMEMDEIKGLTLGADDYITKPFSLMALRVRTENIRRRIEKPKKQVFELSDYRFDFETMEFYAQEQKIILSAVEQRLLRLFLEHQGQTLTRRRLMECVWQEGEAYVDENALSVTVSRLRKKLEIKGRQSPVTTVYGIGYAWKEKPEQNGGGRYEA